MKVGHRFSGVWLMGLIAVLTLVAVYALLLSAGGTTACTSAGCLFPATGDDTHMTLWIILCAVSLLLLLAGIVAAVVLHRKKSKDK